MAPTAPAVVEPESLAKSDVESILVEKLVGNVEELPQRFILPAEHRPKVALTSSTAEIPVIDLSALHDERRTQTLAEIHKACLEWGFFQVINHGVSPSVMQKMKEAVEEFLALPIDERAPNGVKKGVGGQGYGSGYVKPDTGVMDWRDFFLLRTYPEAQRDLKTWPKSPSIREALHKYCEEMKTLSQSLLACFSINLGLRPTYIQEAVGELHQDLLINHYPPCPQPDLAVGANKHTDLGALTCLWQTEDVVGLQVLFKGEWVPVKPIPGAYIINVADQVEFVSNGLYKSIQHRAVVNTQKRRISIAVFYDLHPEAVVSPAPELLDAQHPALYPPIRFADHAATLAIGTKKVGEKASHGAVTALE